MAGEWPDIIRSVRQFNRSTWHYQLGANLTIGGDTAPTAPGPVPIEATKIARLHFAGCAI